jgi:hypothetical protein
LPGNGDIELPNLLLAAKYSRSIGVKSVFGKQGDKILDVATIQFMTTLDV